MKNLFLLLAISGLSLSLSAQKEALKEAASFAEAYPEETVAANFIHVDYSFRVDKKKGDLVVKETTEAEYMGLKKAAWAIFPKFYDTNSEINESKVLTKGEKYTYKIKDEYYNSDGIFHSDSRVRYISAYFDEFGDSKRILFEKTYEDPRYLTTTYFHAPFPSQTISMKFSIPNWVNVELKEMNFEGYKISKQVRAVGSVKEVTYTVKDLGPMERKRGMPGISHIYPHIMILVKDYAIEGKKKFVFRDVNDLYGWYSGLANKSGNETEDFEDLVKEITKDAKTNEDKMKAIFYWVQTNIRYIAFEDGIAGFKPASCQNVYNKKYGDCKGMANLTKEMLKLVDIDARLTWLGTDNLAYDYTIPSLAVDNHMICSVIDGDNTYFLDPTEKYISFGEYAQRIQGKQVMIENGDEYILKTVAEQPAENNTVKLHQKLRLEDERLLGTGDFSFQGESKSGILNAINYTKSEDQMSAIKRYLSEDEKNCIIGDVKHSDLKDLDNEMTINYDFTLDNAVSSFGKEMYVDLDFFKEYYHFELKTPRNYDYVLYFKKNILTTVDLEIPEGYAVKTIPEKLNVKDEAFTFEVGYTEKDGKISYKKHIKVPGGRIPKGKIEDWNDAIKQLKEFYDSPIILEKQ